MKIIKWTEVSEFFKGDGALRDIYFYPANTIIWQKFIGELKKSDYQLRYSFDNNESNIPENIELLFNDYKLGHLLKINKEDIVFCCQFFDPKIIELNFVPNEIIDQNKLNIVLDFMSEFSTKLKVKAVLTMENELNKPFVEINSNSEFQLNKYT